MPHIQQRSWVRSGCFGPAMPVHLRATSRGPGERTRGRGQRSGAAGSTTVGSALHARGLAGHRFVLDRAHHVAYPGQPVPERFAASLVATEDHRFYSEAGIDPFGIAGVTAGFQMGKPNRGGSTLNQQLAKILYVPGRSGALAKSEQILLGVKLALSYPKSEILQMYSSVAYFGWILRPAGSQLRLLRGGPCRAHLAAGGAARGPGEGADCGRPAHAPPPRQGPGAHVLGRLAAMGKLTQAQAGAAYQQPLHLTDGHTSRCADKNAAK
jgi:hypothetical protein